MTTTIVGVSGSLRRGSYNRSLLRAAAALAPDGVTLEVTGIEGIPLFDADLEAEHGLPEAVVALKERIARADGLLLVTPEYNAGIPGVFKNAIDWLSRPASDIPRVFGDKPVALMGATLGRGGTTLSQAGWLPVLRLLGTRPWFGKQLQVSGAGTVFDADGELVDAATRERLAAFVAGFAAWVSEGRRR
jgi:chromate reductase